MDMTPSALHLCAGPKNHPSAVQNDSWNSSLRVKRNVNHHVMRQDRGVNDLSVTATTAPPGSAKHCLDHHTHR